MRTFFSVKKKPVKYDCLEDCLEYLGPIDVLTGMRTEIGLRKKRNLEYLQVKDQLQKEKFMIWSQCLFSEKRHRRRI